ncbi:MAG: dihydrofolate reductase [Clostridiaceae bacterium]
MLSIIVATAHNNVIGKDNTLIWHLPNDLKYFKELTTGKTIIMGRKTFESLPKILPNRKHVVLTRDKNYKVEDERVEIIYSVEELNKLKNDSEEHFIIGGAEIYKLLMPLTDKMYITKIDETFEGDAFFPQYSEKDWVVVDKKSGVVDEKNKHPHDFVVYEKAK